MSETRIKSISASLALVLILGAGPVACSSAPSVIPTSTTQFSVVKRVGDVTISAVDRSKLASLDGIKLLNGAGPHADHQTKFDVALEVQGVGVQFGNDRTYGYMRTDRAFTSDRKVGIRFRFQF